MIKFRAALAGLCASALALPAAAACLQPVEKTAFDVRALQSQLMVVALNCEQQDDYNRFVTTYRGELAGAYRQVAGHFRRAGGQRQLDSYITNLANAQSQDGIRQGSHFCRDAGPLFQQAMGMKTTADLARFSTEKQITQVYTAEPCSVPARRTQAQATARKAQPAKRVQTAAAPAKPRKGG